MMNFLLFAIIIPFVIILTILVTTIFLSFRQGDKLKTVIFGIIALIVIPSTYFVIIISIFGFNFVSQIRQNQNNPEQTMIDILGAGTMGITRNELIEEPANKNSQLEIKLLKLYNFEGRKKGNSVRECNLTLEYKNLSSENLLISTDSNVNFLYYAADKDPKIDKQEIPNQPEKYQNLMVTKNSPITQILPDNSIFLIKPNESLEKTLETTCSKDLLYDFTYYYDVKNFEKITNTNMKPIKIRFDFVQGG